jgi:hypothetical protein
MQTQTPPEWMKLMIARAERAINYLEPYWKHNEDCVGIVKAFPDNPFLQLIVLQELLTRSDDTVDVEEKMVELFGCEGVISVGRVNFTPPGIDTDKLARLAIENGDLAALVFIHLGQYTELDVIELARSPSIRNFEKVCRGLAQCVLAKKKDQAEAVDCVFAGTILSREMIYFLLGTACRLGWGTPFDCHRALEWYQASDFAEAEIAQIKQDGWKVLVPQLAPAVLLQKLIRGVYPGTKRNNGNNILHVIAQQQSVDKLALVYNHPLFDVLLESTNNDNLRPVDLVPENAHTIRAILSFPRRTLSLCFVWCSPLPSDITRHIAEYVLLPKHWYPPRGDAFSTLRPHQFPAKRQAMVEVSGASAAKRAKK